jgi:hypothetical protein
LRTTHDAVVFCLKTRRRRKSSSKTRYECGELEPDYVGYQQMKGINKDPRGYSRVDVGVGRGKAKKLGRRKGI